MKNNQEGKTSRDHELGMHRNITRRDFLNGVVVTAGGVVAGALFPNLLSAQGSERFAQDTPGYYPPTLIGKIGRAHV